MDKPKIMLHIIMPNQISGPNTAAKIIFNSFLSENYNFSFLMQHQLAGSKISISLIKSLIAQINEFNPEIIHLSGLQGSGFHAVVAARLCKKKKILLAIRGSSIDAINISPLLRFIFGTIIEPLTMKLSHTVYTVCKAMERRDYIISNTKNKLIGTIYNSAPKINYNQIVPFNLKEKLEIKNEAIIVSIVGRIIFDKGVTFIAEAIKKINNRNIKFIFIGDEPKKMNFSDQLAKEIDEKKVFFMGKQNDVISILNECDIFLFATLHENLSNALLEACSLGLAVIASNVGGNPEVIKHEFNGLLIPPADADKIVESVVYLANNKEKRLEFGENAKKFICENFSQELLLKKLEKTYIEMYNLIY